MNDSTGIDWMAIVTLLAIIVGPLLAVWVTRISDERREIRKRKMDIFRTLMRTRKMPIHFDHVGALNLIEVEFHNDQEVMAAWRKYLQNLDEKLSPNASNETQNEFIKRRDSLRTKLIHEISKVLNFGVEQLDIMEGSYFPQGWDDEEVEQKVARKSLIEVMSGRRAILIQAYTPSQGTGPYPPAPQIPQNNAE